MASANTLRISEKENFVLNGDSKQKPIAYYIEEACEILHIWKLYQKSLDLSLRRMDPRNDDSIKKFESLTKLPHELSVRLDQYLVFSTFLLSHK